MALKPGTKAYDDWKKKNFNSNVKVPQSAIDKLMKGGTPSANIKKYAGTNDKVMREAMNRFYGKGWEKKAPGFSGKSGGGKSQSPTTPPRNVPSSVAGSAKPTYGTNTQSARAVEGSKGYKAPKKNAEVKKAQQTLNKYMRSSAYRPTTSIGSFNPNAKVSKKDFSYSKLTPNQKDELNTALSLLLIPGVGGLGVKGGIAATRAVRIANVSRLGNRSVKLLEAGKTAKGIRIGQKAISKGEKLAKDSKSIKQLSKLKKEYGKLADKGKSSAPKAPKSAPKTAAKKTAKKTTFKSAYGQTEREVVGAVRRTPAGKVKQMVKIAKIKAGK